MKLTSARAARTLAALALTGGMFAAVGGTASEAQAAPTTPAAPAAKPRPGALATDTDGDSLPDSWETNGYDANGDGYVDVDLPAMGASPRRKDLFVEMDYMSGRLASTAALDRIVGVYAAAPVSNPDGSTGITLHLDAGSARGSAYDLGGGNQVTYDSNLSPALRQTTDIKSANFDSDRAGVFYYMLWADDYDSSCSSGYAFQIPGDTFIVTMGPRCRWSPTENMNVGTFVHEFGHTLGLKHGGTDHVNNKPNYLSVMNYLFQFNGVPRVSGGGYFGYSSVAPPSLDESRLSESSGLGTTAVSTWRTSWYCPDGSTIRTSTGGADKGLDWNCDGDTNDTGAWNINADNTRSVLSAQNNWASLTFGGGAVGGGGSTDARRALVPEKGPRELTKSEWIELRSATRRGHQHDH